MDVCGVDQSLTCTGLAKTTAARVLLTSRVRTGAGDGALGTMRQRIRYITGKVLQFAPAECLSVIEAPIIPRHGGGAVLERAWLFGFLVDQLMLRGPVVQVTPKTRAKYATGNGNADKPEVLAAMQATFPDLNIPDDNVADALALLSMGARWIGEPIDGELSKKQAQAMAAVKWPVMKEREQ